MAGKILQTRSLSAQTAGLLTIIISWSVYLFYIGPTIYWRDSAEFVTSGYTLGVPHPAGSPTYSLIAKIFTFIPTGDIAFRVNLVSAFFGSLSIYLLYRVTGKLIRNLWPQEDERLISYSSFAAAMLFLFSAAFWKFSEVAEVYTQQVFFLLLVLHLLLKAGEDEVTRGKYLMLAALLYGLSAGTHAVMGFYLPAILIYLYQMDKSQLKEAKKICPQIFFLLLGLSVYLYLPIRSSTDPWLDWGDPQTAKALLYHLTDRKDAATHFEIPIRTIVFQLKNYASLLPKQLPYIALLMAAVGFATNLKHRRSWSLLSLIFFTHLAFFIRNWRADFGFIPTFTIMALWCGIGLHRTMLFLSKKAPRHIPRDEPSGRVLSEGSGRAARQPSSRPALLLSLLVGVTVASSFISNRPYADMSHYYSTYRLGKYLLDSIDYNGLLLDQYGWFQTLYFQAVENRRPDVSSILRNAFAFPQFFYRVSNEKFPLLLLPERKSRGTPYSFMMETIEGNLARLPVYWYQVDKIAPLERLVPRGIVFQVLPQGAEIKVKDLQDHATKLYNFMEIEFNDPYFWKDEEGRKVHSLNLTGLAMYFMQNGNLEQAKLMQRLAFMVDETSVSVANNYGVLYEYLRQLDKAEEMYRRAVALEPTDPLIRANLGVALYKQEEDEEAIKQFNQVLAIDPHDQIANYHLGLLALERGDKGTFIQRMASALQEGSDSRIGLKARERLREFRREELKEILPEPSVMP